MLGMKNHFDISDSIEIREVDIAGVTCTLHIQYRYNEHKEVSCQKKKILGKVTAYQT